MSTATQNAMTVMKEEGRALSTVLNSPEYHDKFKAMLPADVPVDKFVAVIMRATQENPDLLVKADKRSLLLACQRAAQDGLIPDGREGALVMYGSTVQWQPMIGGIRKALAEVGFDVRADIVYANDTFDYELGDDPRITHKAPPLGQKRGDAIGGYAIAEDENGKKYREVMSKEEIEYVRQNSKAGPTWNKWWGEMAKKTIIRRLKKQLPIKGRSTRLDSILESDDIATGIDTSNAREPKQPSAAAQRIQAAARGEAKDTGNPEHVGAGTLDGGNGNDRDRDEEIAGEFSEVEGEQSGERADF